MDFADFKNRTPPRLWFGSIHEKQPNHTRGWVQNEKREPTTAVVCVKMRKGDKPHLLAGSKWIKESSYSCGWFIKQNDPIFSKDRII